MKFDLFGLPENKKGSRNAANKTQSVKMHKFISNYTTGVVNMQATQK